MQVLIYNLAIQLYHLAVRLAAPFNTKAAQWIKGRSHYFQQLGSTFSTEKSQPRVWMHCASLGEFEQGRPVLEAIRQQYVDYQIVLTFFSPSGYEIRKNYQGADFVLYLPLDRKKNASRFLDLVQPDLVIFVKYEFWYHFLTQVKSRKIPCILISALFQPRQIFFKFYGGLHRQMLDCFHHIFVQDKASKKLLEEQLAYQSVSVAGDTRVDRVLSIAAAARPFPLVAAFAKSHKIMVCGSTWPADETMLQVLIATAPKGWKFIIAPHEIGEAHLQAIESNIGLACLRYSQLSATSAGENQVLLIDNIGMLSSLYQYADLAYVGGGLGKNIHNILEPGAFHIPLLYGPKHEQFTEAVELKRAGGGFVVSNGGELSAKFEALRSEADYLAASAAVREYMTSHQGATKLVMKYLQENWITASSS